MDKFFIKDAWVENDTQNTRKLCVRYDPDYGAETFGCFLIEHDIHPSEFIGLSLKQACEKFNKVVYPNKSET